MDQLPLIQPKERVLSTLNSDGGRRWLRPKLSTGRFWHRRRILAYFLIGLYTTLPFITINGKQALQLDVINGRFTFFGLTLLPTDLELLALGGLFVFLSIFFATAIFGRIWCGWGCPQTVYMEYVFRPIERFFTGTSGKGGKAKKEVVGWRVAAMYLVYLLICWHLANTFLAYFIGSATLHEWIWNAPPWKHPGAFLLVAFVTGLMMFDFCYWREQLCIIGCPYGRFQSVMLDQSSMIVGYDYQRGETRGKGRNREEKGLGDCVDCKMCVDVCPTGIDIRDGLQLECVNCTQCIDACDAVMTRIGKPIGLIRYSAESTLQGKPFRFIRPRLIIYCVILMVLAVAFLTLLANRKPFDVTLLRGLGRPFVVSEGQVENLIRMQLVNRSEKTRTYSVELIEPAEGSVEGMKPFTIDAGEGHLEPLHIVVPASRFNIAGGIINAVIRISDDNGGVIDSNYRLLGPANSNSPAKQSEPIKK